MPNKKIVRRKPLITGNDEKELSISPDTNDSKSTPELSDNNTQMTDEADVIHGIILEPVGYPITPYDAPDRSMISINKDNQLFQAYAIEQWLGLSVKKGDYIFDQLLLPDFAFKIKKIDPPSGKKIGPDTLFKIDDNKPQKRKFKKVFFEDIVGNKKAIEKAHIILEYLKEPEKFGEWAPKNILFYGPPGTGKTLTAKAIASISNCAFLARKGTSLIGLHVGDGASKIHSLFREARKLKPAIIFIDEIDSIALNRTYQSVRGDVIEVATALLSELDGLDPSDGIITIAATNGIGLLDLGIRNRFEEEIEFPLPTEEERKEMLQLFSEKIPISSNIDYTQIARVTDQWSGRALHEKLIKLAVHQAIREKSDIVTTNMLMQIIKHDSDKKQKKTSISDIFS